MQDKATATWVIAAVLIGAMLLLSYFPSTESTAEPHLTYGAHQDTLGTVLGENIGATVNKFTN